MCDDNRECHHSRTSTGVARQHPGAGASAAAMLLWPQLHPSARTASPPARHPAQLRPMPLRSASRPFIVYVWSENPRSTTVHLQIGRVPTGGVMLDDRIAVGCCERDGICHSCCCAGGDISQHRQQRQDSTGLRSRCDAVPPSLGAACPRWLHPRTWKGCSSGVQHVDAGHHLSTASGAIMSDHSASQDHTRHTRKLIVARACASL